MRLGTLLLVALMALIPRLYVATTTTYVWDEERDWIPLANSISLEPATWNTPIRGAYHPALPAYGIALGRAVLGHNVLGSRAVGLMLGVATVVLIFVLVRGAWGTLGAAWIGSLLLAANEYHIHASLLATEKAYYLFFAAVAVLFFLRFLQQERAKWLYLAAAATGFSFLCKETAALLVPVFFITLVASRHRVWFRRWEPYVAVLLFVLVISPDLWWNFGSPHAGARADYRKHLLGIGSLGITYQPMVLYGREAVAWLLAKVGRPFYDNAEEYAAGNFLLSLVIAAGVVSTAWHSKKRGDARVVLFLTLFAFVFLFFTVVGRGGTADLDAFGFFWGDLSLIGGVVLGGLWAGEAVLSRWTRFAVAGLLVSGVLLSADRVFRQRFGGAAVEVRTDPDVIEDAPGVFRPVTVHFNYCTFCDKNPRVELISVRSRNGRTEMPADESARLVDSVTLGTDDRALRVESSALEPPQIKSYLLEYRLQSRGGGARRAVTSIRVRKVRPDTWPPWEW